MLETNSTFIEWLRNDKIAAPAVRRFTKESWKQDFQELGSGTDEERAIYEARLWVSDALKGMWSNIADLNLGSYSFDNLVIRLMTLSYAEIYRQTAPNVSSRPGPLTDDYGTTALGDALWRALNFLHSGRFPSWIGPD